jgi:acetyl esterase/lipase
MPRNKKRETTRRFAPVLEQLECRRPLAQGNLPPVLTVPSAEISFTENAAPVLVAPSATVTDSDSSNFNHGTLTIFNAVNGEASDLVNIRSDGRGPGQVNIDAYRVNYGGTQIGSIAEFNVAGHGTNPLIVKFNSHATAAAVQAVVRHVQFQNLGDGPSSSPRQLTFDLTGQFVSTRHVYKTVGGQSLSLVVNKPWDWKASDRRPAIVIMSNWFHSTNSRFDEYCRYLASRGMVCIQVEARTIPVDGTDPPDICIMDCKSAMRWVRAHAVQLGINPYRIAAAGPSSGGQLAAASAMINGVNDPSDNLHVSAKANALLLINPVIDNGPDGGWGYKQTGDRYRELSPAHNISHDDPPTILFFGDHDRDVPFSTVQRFHANMLNAGVRCDLVVFPGQDHAFWNPDMANQEYNYKVLRGFDKFLTSLGWLSGPATLPLPPSYAVATHAVGSENMTQVTAKVVGVNDAPLLNVALNPILNGVTKNAANPSGTPVANLLVGVTDPDLGAKQGVAITSVASTFGTWQFSLNGGKSWIDIENPSESAAMLVPGYALIRFIPKSNFSGQVKLSYRAWDQTQGSSGGTMDLQGSLGGTNAFSLAAESATLTVQS